MLIQFLSSDWLMNGAMLLFCILFLMLTTTVVVWCISLFAPKRTYRFKAPVSVIIPAYNEEKNISRCVESVLASEYKPPIEIICIDDGSTDRTQDIIKHYPVRLITSKHIGKPRVLNKGIDAATHDFIITIDADTVIHPKFIAKSMAPFADPEVGATNGLTLLYKPRRLIELFQVVEYHLNNTIRLAFSRVFRNGIWFFGAAAAFRKSALVQAGKFTTTLLTEDMDMSLKIYGAGYKVLTINGAKYYTEGCATIAELLKQRMRWFFGGLQCVKQHKQLAFRKSFAIKYLFVNQLFWSVYSLLIIPIITYQVWFWLPADASMIPGYLFRWFSLTGPFYVLYKIPEWGLSFLNIFGVMSGILTAGMMLSGFFQFKVKFTPGKALAIFFFFPYTILLNLALVLSLFKYAGKKNLPFIKP